jgi:hypothetical protein
MSKKTYHVCFRVIVTVQADNFESALSLADERFKYGEIEGDGVFNEYWDEVKE